MFLMKPKYLNFTLAHTDHSNAFLIIPNRKKNKQKNTLFICLLQTLCNIYLPYEKNVKGAEERSNKANNVLGIHVSWNEISFT